MEVVRQAPTNELMGDSIIGTEAAEKHTHPPHLRTIGRAHPLLSAGAGGDELRSFKRLPRPSGVFRSVDAVPAPNTAAFKGFGTISGGKSTPARILLVGSKVDLLTQHAQPRNTHDSTAKSSTISVITLHHPWTANLGNLACQNLTDRYAIFRASGTLARIGNVAPSSHSSVGEL